MANEAEKMDVTLSNGRRQAVPFGRKMALPAHTINTLMKVSSADHVPARPRLVRSVRRHDAG